MTITLYTATGSNSSQRVEWTLNYKKIGYRRVDVSSHELATSYRAINSFGYVPSLCVDECILSESMAIIEYLEERFPQLPLLGESLREKASIRRICEYVNATIHSAQNRTVLNFFRPDLDEQSKKQLRGDWITQCLQDLSSELCRQSGYALGGRFSLADIFVASIYKKALQHGCQNLPFYDEHLCYVRSDPDAKCAEPTI
ncbi:glutathione S-transferase family protein [Celerinatantimonas diazotrophica]|uniref:Maleylacetoacetate isomerase n=1 Tax=Celerinatantimonas diazotrophica TaxID=412034 RepID=A0A4R1JL98_9GAMM|nr:glutathione S-transferase N-terminal domain-containing protein [Celerinatantimonas diazotrophica]TCK51824.1 maleylacetoacetate isomerase [Celerinatantimonas diazotrophica]CAG9296484.1 Maleylpyruvate isomerase [Celerinatantimonas diazotrophica]